MPYIIKNRRLVSDVPDITPTDITGSSATSPASDAVAAEGADVVIPATQPTTETGTLSLRYVDGAAVLVVHGGNAIPGELPVVDANGNAVATYTPGKPSAPTTARSLDIEIPDYKIDDVIQAAV
ncbi:hypothetical protein ABZ705_20280 [Streptomyces sp. NPDC006984]|uniref:hypothetical protein n=1 Tax=Streptomyces sp. NPDC006984 TaxID=3155463 RepID=UPI0033ECD70D